MADIPPTVRVTIEWPTLIRHALSLVHGHPGLDEGQRAAIVAAEKAIAAAEESAWLRRPVQEPGTVE